jgi:hypothetical protein
MTNIITPKLTLEHWPANQETGQLTMFRSMQENTDSAQWANREKSVAALIAWWVQVSSYDPDLEPESLIKRQDLNELSKEILGIAAANRVRPRGKHGEVPNMKETQDWVKSSEANTLRHALEMEDTSQWWTRCLFEGTHPWNWPRIQYLVSASMAHHPFVQMATSLNIPLRELLPMMPNPTACIQDPPALPDLC